jgi:hypothetical protein
MEMQELEITIDNEGRMLVQVRGTHGDECLAVTKDLEDAVGTVSERTFLAEYYEQPLISRERRHVGR